MFKIKYFIFVWLLVPAQIGIGQPEGWTKVTSPYDTVDVLGLNYALHYSENLGSIVMNGRVVVGELDEDFNFTISGYHSFPFYDGENWGYLGTCDYFGSTTHRAITDYKDGFVTAQPSCNDELEVFDGPSYYDGQEWHSLGVADQSINYLTEIDDTLYMAGHFTYVGDDYAPYIAKYNGQNWESAFAVMPEFTNSNIYIRAIEQFEGEWYIGGSFSAIEGENLLVFRNGNWHSVVGENGDSLSDQSQLQCMEIFQGELYVGGLLTQSQGDVGDGVQKWNGQNWNDVGGGLQGGGFYTNIFELLTIDNKLYCIGSFYTANFEFMKYLAMWDGIQWCGMQTNNLEFGIHNIAQWSNKLFASVLFNPFEDNSHYHIHDGTTFTPCTPTVSITDEVVTQKNIFTIHPNPCTNHFSLEFQQETSQPLEMVIYTLTGQQAIAEQLSGNQRYTIDISNLEAGMYIVQLMENGQPAGTSKLVVQGR